LGQKRQVPFCRLLDEAVIDRTVLGRILESFGLADKFKKFESQFHEE